MVRRPPRSTQSRSSAASDVYKRQAPDPDRRGGLVCQFLEFGQRLFHYDRRKVKGCIIAAFRCREGRDRDADGMKEAGELGRGKIKR